MHGVHGVSPEGDTEMADAPAVNFTLAAASCCPGTMESLSDAFSVS